MSLFEDDSLRQPVSLQSVRVRPSVSANCTRQSSDLTLLPLFLNLLAIFALLVAASEIRPEKAELAVNSIVSTFQYDAATDVLSGPSREFAQTGKAMDQFRQFAERLVSLRRVSVSSSDDHIRLDFTAAQLFDEPQGVLKVAHRALLVRLADLQRTQSANWALSVFADLPSDDRANTAIRTLVYERLVGLQSDFESGGISLDQVGIRLVSAPAPQFAIELQRRTTEGRLADFGDSIDEG